MEKKTTIIFSRLTSSLKDKNEFYQNHIAKGTMSADLPFIIFLSLGALSDEMNLYPDGNGIELTGILFGKGMPTITMNPETREVVCQGYTFRQYIEKWNKQRIDSAIFAIKNTREWGGELRKH